MTTTPLQPGTVPMARHNMIKYFYGWLVFCRDEDDILDPMTVNEKETILKIIETSRNDVVREWYEFVRDTPNEFVGFVYNHKPTSIRFISHYDFWAYMLGYIEMSGKCVGLNLNESHKRIMMTMIQGIEEMKSKYEKQLVEWLQNPTFPFDWSGYASRLRNFFRANSRMREIPHMTEENLSGLVRGLNVVSKNFSKDTSDDDVVDILDVYKPHSDDIDILYWMLGMLEMNYYTGDPVHRDLLMQCLQFLRKNTKQCKVITPVTMDVLEEIAQETDKVEGCLIMAECIKNLKGLLNRFTIDRNVEAYILGCMQGRLSRGVFCLATRNIVKINDMLRNVAGSLDHAPQLKQFSDQLHNCMEDVLKKMLNNPGGGGDNTCVSMYKLDTIDAFYCYLLDKFGSMQTLFGEAQDKQEGVEKHQDNQGHSKHDVSKADIKEKVSRMRDILITELEKENRSETKQWHLGMILNTLMRIHYSLNMDSFSENILDSDSIDTIQTLLNLFESKFTTLDIEATKLGINTVENKGNNTTVDHDKPIQSANNVKSSQDSLVTRDKDNNEIDTFIRESIQDMMTMYDVTDNDERRDLHKRVLNSMCDMCDTSRSQLILEIKPLYIHGNMNKAKSLIAQCVFDNILEKS